MDRNTRKRRIVRSLLPLGLAASFLLVTPAGRADSRPVVLDRLPEKEAIRRVERAAPTDVFIVRGRKVTARSLQDALVPARRRATADARRAAEASRAARYDDLEIARLRAGLAAQALSVERKERFDRLAAERRRTLPPDSPEIRRLSEEAARLAGAWIFASPEERRSLEERSRRVVEELRRLGVEVNR